MDDTDVMIKSPTATQLLHANWCKFRRGIGRKQCTCATGFEQVLGSPLNEPQSTVDRFADWLATWFEQHARAFQDEDIALGIDTGVELASYDRAALLANDLHAAGFVVMRVDDLSTSVQSE